METETRNEILDEQAEIILSRSDSKLPVPRNLPKKGILKRAASHSGTHSEVSDTLSPLRSDTLPFPRGYTPPKSNLPPEVEAKAGGSKIPRNTRSHSVSWWETSSAYGDYNETRRRRGGSVGSDDEDASSVTSSNSIAGTWWFGRSTRYVPHCERRHLKELDPKNYKTPTQKKNQQINDLKKQLTQSTQLLDDKENHLSQLRERLGELESLLEGDGGLAESARLKAQLRLSEERHTEKYDQLRLECNSQIRKLTRQLEKEKQKNATLNVSGTSSNEFGLDIMDDSFFGAHSEADSGLGEQNIVQKSKLNSCVQTEDQTLDTSSDQIQQLEAYKYECFMLRGKVAEMEFNLKQLDKDLELAEGDTCGSRACLTKRHELNAQVQAYKNECLVWRTKSAELEIMLKKQQQTAAYALQDKLNNPGLQYSEDPDLTATDKSVDNSEMLRLQAQVTDLERQLQKETSRGCNRTLSPSKDEVSLDSILSERDVNKSRSKSLEQKNAALNEDLLNKMKEMRSLEGIVAELERRLSAKSTETEAAKLGLVRLRNENETLQREVADVDDRLRMMHNAMLDHGLITGLHSAKRMVTTSQADVYRSQSVQTTLDMQELELLTKDSSHLRNQLEDVSQKWKAECSDLTSRLTEVTTNLNLKTSVINTLTGQINTLQKDIETMRDAMEEERQVYSTRLEEVCSVAARVPLLEMELDSAHADLGQTQFQLNLDKTRYQQSMSDTLVEGLESQKSAEQRWADKVDLMHKQISEYKEQMNKAEKAFKETSLRLNLEKTDLGLKLEQSYKKISELTDIIYLPHEDKGVWAYPDTRDKLTACFPITADGECQVEKGDLPDDGEEKVKSIQGELIATQIQVTKLQSKLLEAEDVERTLGESNSQRNALENLLKSMRKELALVRGVWQCEKDDLDARVQMAEHEKHITQRKEQDTMQHLETEFDCVKAELDSMLTEYEYERQKMAGTEALIEGLSLERDQLISENKGLKSRLEEWTPIEQVDVDTETVAINVVDASTTVSTVALNHIDTFVQTETQGNDVAVQVNVPNPKLVQSLRLLQVAKLAEVPEEESVTLVDLSGLEKKIEELSAECEEVEEEGLMTPSLGTPRRKRDAASEYLLKRLNDERAKYMEIKEQMELDVKKLGEELTEAKAELADRSESASIHSTWSWHRSLSSFSLGRSKSIPNIVVTPSGEISLATDAAGSVVALADEHSAQLRAKNLCLMKENQQLMSGFELLRQSVGNLIERHEPGPRKPTSPTEEPDPADLDAILKSFETLEHTLHEPDSDRFKQPQVKCWPQVPADSARSELASDLLNVRKDLEGILIQMDNASPAKEGAEVAVPPAEQREGALMNWLETELKEDKRELDVIVKWYEQDKRRLEKELKQVKDDRSALQMDVDRIDLENHDMETELEFYKMEDLRKSMQVSKIRERGELVRCMSDGELHIPRDGSGLLKWKWKAGAMFRDICKLRRNYVKAEEDRRDKGQTITIIKGEIEVLKAELETYRDRASHWESLKEAEALAEKEKHTMQDMDNAMQAVIDNQQDIIDMWGPRDGTRTQKTLTASLPTSPTKPVKETKSRSGKNCKVDKAVVVVSASKTELETIKQLHQVEIKRARVQIEEYKLGEKRHLKEVEKLKEDKECLQDHLNHLKDSLLKSQYEISELSDGLKGKQKTLEEIQNEAGESEGKREDMGEKLVHYFNNLIRMIQVQKDTQDFRQDHMKIKACIRTLEMSLENFKENICTSTSQDSTPAKNINDESIDSVVFHTPPLESPNSLQNYPSINSSQFQTLEGPLNTEKDLEIDEGELRLYRQKEEGRFNELRAQNEELKEKLSNATAQLKEVNQPSQSLTSALETAKILQEKVNHLQEEMNEKEEQHQAMYLQMFQKGQDTAKAEILGDSIEPQDRTTVCTIPFPKDLWEEVSATRGKEGLSNEEVVLRFLRDSVYYFLINPKDAKDHLQAIMSLLKFSEHQRQDVVKKKNLHLELKR